MPRLSGTLFFLHESSSCSKRGLWNAYIPFMLQYDWSGNGGQMLWLSWVIGGQMLWIQQLHWLPISSLDSFPVQIQDTSSSTYIELSSIQNLILVLAFKALHDLYIPDLCLRQALSVLSPQLWNSFPGELNTISSLMNFWQRIKTYLIHLAFGCYMDICTV